MFSDDFWSEADQKRKGLTETILCSFCTKVAASIQKIFAPKHAPDDLDHDALGDHVTVPKELSEPEDASL